MRRVRREARLSAIVTLTLNPALDIATSVERLVPGPKLRCAPPAVYPGGGGINVARVAARLGGEVLALYAAGGAAGDLLGRLLAGEGVATEVIPIAGTTRENFTVQEVGGGEYRFVLPGPELSAAEWQACLARCVALGDRARLVVASGSLPPGVPEDFYAQLASRLGGQSRLVLDSSGAALAAALQQGVFAIKPSLAELRQLIGQPLDTAAGQLEACRGLVRSGRAAMVVLSLGRDGAMLVTAQGAWRAAALPVAVAGTVGAGDSLVGALACALVRDAPPDEALRQAMAASAATVQAGGTALCDAQQVRALAPQVVVERL